MSVRNTKSISSLGVEKAVKQYGPVCEERLIGVLMERFSVSSDQAESAITDAMMDGRVFRNPNDKLARTGFYE